MYYVDDIFYSTYHPPRKMIHVVFKAGSTGKLCLLPPIYPLDQFPLLSPDYSNLACTFRSMHCNSTTISYEAMQMKQKESD